MNAFSKLHKQQSPKVQAIIINKLREGVNKPYKDMEVDIFAMMTLMQSNTNQQILALKLEQI